MTGPRIVVITGASRGIGRAVALEMAGPDTHIVAVARTQGALEELDDAIAAKGGPATLVPLDIRDFDALDRLGMALLEQHGRVDAVFANAGVLGKLSPLAHIEEKVWREVMDVNVTAVWRLVRALDPALRRSEAGRVLFVTSGVARAPKAYWAGYAISKAAIDAMAKIYAQESEKAGIRANLISPGPIRTNMRAKAMPGEDPDTLDTPEMLAPHIARLLSPETEETGRIWDYRTKDWLDG
ncbi:MAG: SDR family NAD(P)-dependent oxidoreductase [Pseudomonadota bacterium]